MREREGRGIMRIERRESRGKVNRYKANRKQREKRCEMRKKCEESKLRRGKERPAGNKKKKKKL